MSRSLPVVTAAPVGQVEFKRLVGGHTNGGRVECNLPQRIPFFPALHRDSLVKDG
jgi:hypothetical protein